jgi:hypothetical protein
LTFRYVTALNKPATSGESNVDRTNAERQRRYRVNRKAAAADSTSLLRENTALRQRVTALEQELAQQRTVAKPGLSAAEVPNGKIAKLWKDKGIKREGLGMEAPEAAKARTERCPAHRRWVPSEAWRVIEKAWEYPYLDDRCRAALRRFATDPAMREVWQKLPPEPEGLAEAVIGLALYALVIFPLLRPRPRSKKSEVWKKWAQHLHDHPRALDWQACAGLAIELRDVLAATPDEAWVRNWRGDSAVNRVSASGFLGALADCFQSLLAEVQSFESDMRLPPVARWDDPRAPQRFFAVFMSEKMYALCGRYFDLVISALTGVAFPDLESPGAATVRGWRRMQAAK